MFYSGVSPLISLSENVNVTAMALFYYVDGKSAGRYRGRCLVLYQRGNSRIERTEGRDLWEKQMASQNLI